MYELKTLIPYTEYQKLQYIMLHTAVICVVKLVLS
jgi:hypothetical protein